MDEVDPARREVPNDLVDGYLIGARCAERMSAYHREQTAHYRRKQFHCVAPPNDHREPAKTNSESRTPRSVNACPLVAAKATLALQHPTSAFLSEADPCSAQSDFAYRPVVVIRGSHPSLESTMTAVDTTCWLSVIAAKHQFRHVQDK